MKKFTLAAGIVALLCTLYFITPQVSRFIESESEEEENELLESQNKLRYIEEAIRQEVELTKSPYTGKVPKEKLLEAEQYATQRLAQRGNNTTFRSIQGINWVERGPTNVGGRTRALLYDLNDVSLKKVYAGAVDGGLWVCNDISQATPTWNKVNDHFDNLAVTTIAQQKTDPGKMYFGTGEGWFNVDAVQGLGMWRSSDGGATWQHLPSTLDGNFNAVQKVIVTDNGFVYAATSPGGIMRSKNGGLTWEKVLSGGPGADLEIGADGKIWASLGIFSAGSLWVSETGNPGSWTAKTPANPATSGMQRIEIATAPSNANTLYILGHDGNSSDCKNIWRSIDGGNTWTLCSIPAGTDQVPTNPNFTRSQAWYDLIAAVDPNNPLTLIIGGVDLHKSIDGGTTWFHLTKWYNSILTAFPTLPTVHADQHAIVFKPGSSNEVLFGNDGGVFHSTNINTAVSDAVVAKYDSKNNGYNVTQFYAVAAHPTNPNYFLAGAQDNGSQRFNGGSGAVSTTEATGGDGAFCHIDQKDPNYQFTSYVYNSYYRSTNGGASFSSTVNNSTNGTFINPTALDDNSKILYADYTTVSTRVGGQYAWWNTRGSSTSMTPVTVTNFANGSVTNVTVSPAVSNRIYFGLNNGRVVFVDGANTTGTVSGTLIRTGVGSVSGIAIDPANEGHIVVTYSNYDVQSVFETIDGGENWTSIEGNLPNMPIRWVVFNPGNSDQAFLATEVGVWSTDDINGTSTQWNPTNGGLANCRVDMLKIAGNQMAAATHGRGLFTAVLNSSTVNAPMINFEKPNGGGAEAAANTPIACGRGYIDYPVRMFISAAPTGAATVNLGIDGTTTTATEGQDYEIIPKTLTFASGSTDPQSFVIRVYNDANTESPFEFFNLHYSISGATNVVKGTAFQQFSFRIGDEDYLKIPHGPTTVAIPSGFYTTNLGGSSPLQGSQSDKKMQFLYRKNELLAMGLKPGPIYSLSFLIGTKGSVIPYNGLSIQMGAVPVTMNRLSKLRGFVSTAGFTTVYSGSYTTVSGENKFNMATPFVWDGNSNIVLQFCYNNVASAPAAPVALPAGGGDDILQGEQDPQSDTVQLRAVSTNVPTDDGCGFAAPTIFNIFRPLLYLGQVAAETPVQTMVNRSKVAYLGPNEDVYFYDETDGKLLARIENLSNLDYGCTTIEVDRAVVGSSFTQPFWNTSSGSGVTSKSFKVLPAQNGSNASGHYRLTLYYTGAEKAGYESATGKSWSSTQMVKVSNGRYVPDVTPTTPYASDVTTQPMTAGAVGSGFSATAEFTNATFSGFAIGTPGAVNAPLPANLLSFTGKLQGDFSQLQWTVANEDHTGYSVERSADGRNFNAIGYVAAQRGAAEKQYSFSDPAKAGAVQYYRLLMAGAVGTAKYSNIIKVQKNSAGVGVQVFPTVTTGTFNVKYSQPSNAMVVIEVLNVIGARVANKVTAMRDEQMNISQLTPGAYHVNIRSAQTGELLNSTKIIKQ